MARKIPEGEFRNKEKTKKKLIAAVGEVLHSQGHTKLGINNIANTAGVSKRLIYRYFGTVENLVKTYVREQDYWLNFTDDPNDLFSKNQPNDGRVIANLLIENLFDHLEANPETLSILRWEICEKSKLMREICRSREALGSQLFKMGDSVFNGTGIDIRAVYAAILAGTY